MQKIKITDVAILFLGIGIGVIFTAIIFYFNPKIEYKEYTDEEIVSKYTEIKLKDKRENSNLSEDDKNKDKKQENEKHEDKEDNQQKQEKEKKIKKLVINKGESVNDIIDKLYEINIIDNKENFLDRLKVRRATQKIEYGEYEIKTPISYDKIIDEIILK